MISDYFKLAIRSLKKRKLRSWLTILGIVIAIATIFTLISLSIGLQNAVTEQFRMLGIDKFFVMALGQAGGPGSGGAVELTTNDVNVIEKVNGVKSVSYFTAGNAKIEFSGKAKYFFVIGLPLDKTNALESLFESMSMKIDDGRAIRKDDKGVVMVGYDYKYNNVFSKPVKAGSKIKINDKEFTVIGIVSKIGNPSDDKNIYMSLDDFKELYNSGDRVDEILVQVDAGQDIKIVADKVDRKLMKFRDVTEKTKDFSILTPEELLGTFQTILAVITGFLFGIAAISLLVGGVGIANTMYTSVLERTQEIGTMKSVGAKNSDIYKIFIIESGLIGLIGGIFGVIFGIGVSKGISLIAGQALGTNLFQAATPWYLIAGCLIFAFAIGAFAGSIPSWQASKLSPVEALRYE